MNLQESDILKSLLSAPFVNQRTLAERSGHSVGIVNKCLKSLTENGYLDDRMQLSGFARETIQASAPRNAIILAAGFGMRMVPINLSTPKALIEVNGERLIDRLISSSRLSVSTISRLWSAL